MQTSVTEKVTLQKKLHGVYLASFGSPKQGSKTRNSERKKIKGGVIRLGLYGFDDAAEKAAIASLFTHAKHWKQPWQVVDDITGADFLLVASNVDSMFVPPLGQSGLNNS